MCAAQFLTTAVTAHPSHIIPWCRFFHFFHSSLLLDSGSSFEDALAVLAGPPVRLGGVPQVRGGCYVTVTPALVGVTGSYSAPLHLKRNVVPFPIPKPFSIQISTAATPSAGR